MRALWPPLQCGCIHAARKNYLSQLPNKMDATMIINYFPTHLHTKDAIDTWYRALALIYHPDKEGGDSEIMQIINEQYEQLKDNGYKHYQNNPIEKTNDSFVVKLNGNDYNLMNRDDRTDFGLSILKNFLNGKKGL